VNLDFFDSFPLLHTDRLELRELQVQDAHALFDVFSDDEVTRFYDVETMVEPGPAVQMVARMRQRFVDRAGIRWAITQKSDGCVIGTIGFNSITAWAHRGVIGYELLHRSWGQGLATEAAAEVVRFGHETMGLNRIEAAVMIGNESSVRVLQKLGFKEEGVMRAYGYWKGLYHDLRMFSVLRAAEVGSD
jgi:[ribosomal protein S5]-alanine N-acetyltransferase